jgi:hypothetical protein
MGPPEKNKKFQRLFAFSVNAKTICRDAGLSQAQTASP